MTRAFGLALVAGVALLAVAGSANAAAYMKLGDIKGESSARGKDHKDWIEISSLQWASTDSSAAGGVNVATGDVTGDGRADVTTSSATPRDAASGQATGKRQHNPVRLTMELDRAAAKPADGVTAGAVTAGEGETTAALLLPAVQKVRSATLPRARGETCVVGMAFETVEVRDGKDGAVGVIRDATVSACTSETLSLNFTKIEY